MRKEGVESPAAARREVEPSCTLAPGDFDPDRSPHTRRGGSTPPTRGNIRTLRPECTPIMTRRPGPYVPLLWKAVTNICRVGTIRHMPPRPLLARARRALAITGLAAVLMVILGSLALAAVDNLDDTNTEVIHTRRELNAYADLQRMIDRQALAEVSYMRAPSTGAWNRVEGAVAVVPHQIALAKKFADRDESTILDRIATLNARYVSEIQIIKSDKAPLARDTVAGPALDEMNAVLERAIYRHRDAVTSATHDESHLIGHLQIILPVTFATAFVLLTWTTMANHSHGHRVVLQAQIDAPRAARIAWEATSLTQRPTGRSLKKPAA